MSDEMVDVLMQALQALKDRQRGARMTVLRALIFLLKAHRRHHEIVRRINEYAPGALK